MSSLVEKLAMENLELKDQQNELLVEADSLGVDTSEYQWLELCACCCQCFSVYIFLCVIAIVVFVHFYPAY